MNLKLRKKLAIFFAVISIAISLLFFLNANFSQSLDERNYRKLEDQLTGFECSQKRSNKVYYYFSFSSGDKYWSYMRGADWPSCSEADNFFSEIINEYVIIWVKDFQLVQMKKGTNYIIDLNKYIGSHKMHGYETSAVFLLLSIVFYLYSLGIERRGW